MGMIIHFHVLAALLWSKGSVTDCTSFWVDLRADVDKWEYIEYLRLSTIRTENQLRDVLSTEQTGFCKWVMANS
jgi:hypothetical protein